MYFPMFALSTAGCHGRSGSRSCSCGGNGSN